MEKKDLKPVDFVYEINKPLLSFVGGNRPINIQHMREIKEAMRNGAFVPPVMVNTETNEIIDGQHRYRAACELWNEGIGYSLLVVFHDYGNALNSAIVYNNRSRVWKAKDYVRAYITQGNESYLLLQRFCDTHEYMRDRYTAASQIISGNGDHIKDGLFKATEASLVKAEQIYSELVQMTEITECPLIIRRNYVLAWMEVRSSILGRMSFWEFIAKLKENFSVPFSDKKVDWENEYMRIALKQY